MQPAPVAPVRLPLVLLGGAEPDDPLRVAAHADDRIWGYKGVRLSLAGQPLVQLVIERFRSTGLFDPIFVAGPRRAFGGVVDDDALIDTDAAFGSNIRTAVDRAGRSARDAPVAVATLDLVPDADEIAGAVGSYREADDPDFWSPLVLLPEDRERLRPFRDKPTYRFIARDGAAVEVLPCHLVIARPGSIRNPFLFNLLDVAYQTREKPVLTRRNQMLRRLLPALVGEEIQAMARLRAPTQTWRMVRAGLAIAAGLRSGDLAVTALETHLAALLLRPPERRGRARRVAIPLLEVLSLALDADTRAQAAALGLRVSD